MSMYSNHSINRKTIIFLYTHVTPSFLSVIKLLSEKSIYKIIIFYWEKGGSTPYEPPKLDNVVYIKSKKFSSIEILACVKKYNINLVYVTAWQDKRYLLSCLHFIKNKVPVVAGFDDVWDSTLRQRIGCLVIKIIKKYFFSHAMVSGLRQYEYAIRFGFNHKNILYHLFSADINKFDSLPPPFERNIQSQKSFIFVGQLIYRKGIDILKSAFDIYRNQLNGSWTLNIVGSGKQSHILESIDGIILHGYQNHDDLLNLLRSSNVFILPSRRDVSPLVVHEFASAGFPLILSNSIGNRHLFLIDGYNGYSFENEDPNDLAEKMKKISSISEYDLLQMMINSKKLSDQHNPEFVASSLTSLL